MLKLTWDQVRAWWLRRQQLAEPGGPAGAAGIRQAVTAIGQVQAQILTAAELSVGIRVRGGTRDAVRSALWEERSLVKTYGLRGTLHLVAADELAMWNAAMRARPYWAEQAWRDAFGVTTHTADALFAAIGDALTGACLTREELAAAIGERIGPALHGRLTSTWGELLRPAAYLGLLCFGPSRGSKVTFVRPADWLGRQPEADPRQAIAEAVRRYFSACAPATHRELGRWFGLRPGPAKDLFGLVAGELAEVDIEGKSAWVLAADVADGSWAGADLSPAGPSVRLVGQYESYILGCGPRQQVLPESARPRIFAVGRGRFEGPVANQLLLVDGLVSGMWERRQRGTGLEVLVECFTELDRAGRRALDGEVERIGKFYGGDATLRLGQVGMERPEPA
jgi:hypothetical protein